MSTAGRYFDPDPPAPGSPRLFAEVEHVPRSKRPSGVSGRATSPAKLRRLRRMAIIKACRDATPSIPYSTLVCELEISDSQARLLYKKACRYDLRRSRV